MFDFFRARLAKALLALVGLALFCVIGVIVRQHSGVCVIIRNESNEPVRELRVSVENQGDGQRLPDLRPGEHERVFVKTVENSRLVLQFTEAGQKPHTATVFDHATLGDCGATTVRLLPRRSTESVEVHRSVSWRGWRDFF
jgi:hypothetical protein